jgi:hypothetical protein
VKSADTPRYPTDMCGEPTPRPRRTKKNKSSAQPFRSAPLPPHLYVTAPHGAATDPKEMNQMAEDTYSHDLAWRQEAQAQRDRAEADRQAAQQENRRRLEEAQRRHNDERRSDLGAAL